MYHNPSTASAESIPMGNTEKDSGDNSFSHHSGAMLTAYENRRLRALIEEMDHELWLKKRIKILWPYVVALMGGIVWAVDTLYKHFKH